MASKLDSAELKDILRLLKSGLLASDEKISALFGLHNDDEKLSALLGLDDDDFDHKIDFAPSQWSATTASLLYYCLL